MAANRRKQDDKNLEILRELISMNGNKYCLDCNQRGPTYVNTTIGSFVCSKCSGMLRGLTPPHRVKSISMATFTPEEIEFIKERGNDYCRRVWLGLYEGESVNFADEQSVKDFMSDKYEKKRYYLETASNIMTSNGNLPSKNQTKGKTTSNSTATLVSIPQHFGKSANNNNTTHLAKIVNNFTPANETSHKVPRPINNIMNNMPPNNMPLLENPSPAPVPDFPVDFSTANIYNSAQTTSTVNNNFIQPIANSTQLTAFNSTSTTSNDRYAALADLDLELRKQNMRSMEETPSVASKNPFQSTNTSDIFGNKNPFFNGGWSSSMQPINPFMPTTNNGAVINSKNPFL
ncbi:arf-GAP domain and FG repeat-containing protein 1 [Aricia agestis]|uniref:arf-GAP domain and FG repeat-containing protein 1 n=1 Tax=Aricia agestis TaxID=91739 RepID=UPI001C206B19|nr:arf-GAP domain and FG repeat-containing protein 1 [Aricia agestis]